MTSQNTQLRLWTALLIGAALLFMYASVIWKLGSDWWADDNYSHGLLIPFVVAFAVWQRFERLREAVDRSGGWLGWSLISFASLLLLGGTLASVLVAQRLSLLLMIAGLVVCFFGARVLRQLFMPFALLALAIPVPQILFNKIAFPLQLFASRIAEGAIRLAGIATERNGNVIEIPFAETGEIVSLEVVEACSGIRSLVTLITLALILGHFTRERRERLHNGFRGLLLDRDIQRTLLLMTLAIPAALLTNAARVVATGLIAYFYGPEGVEGPWHDISGSAVFLAALVILLALNFLFKRVFSNEASEVSDPPSFPETLISSDTFSAGRSVAVFLLVLFCGVFVNWFQYRGELHVGRRPLSEVPSRLGDWEQRNPDIRFDPESEKVLRASDYVMRDYYGPGKRLNLYVGYYASQRNGSTYHSPLSCLPGTGWEMSDPQMLDVETPGGRRFSVNRYIVSRGPHQEFLIYWYQGRGRTLASEYYDKLYTSLDSVTMRRSDGGMVRIMTPLGKDADRSLAAALDLTKHVADNIGEFLPD